VDVVSGAQLSSDTRKYRSQWAKDLGARNRGKQHPQPRWTIAGGKLHSRWNRWLARLNGDDRDDARDAERAHGIADMHMLLEQRCKSK
jgi:hypothetical protein